MKYDAFWQCHNCGRRTRFGEFVDALRDTRFLCDKCDRDNKRRAAAYLDHLRGWRKAGWRKRALDRMAPRGEASRPMASESAQKPLGVGKAPPPRLATVPGKVRTADGKLGKMFTCKQESPAPDWDDAPPP